jgi:hypothetical protein
MADLNLDFLVTPTYSTKTFAITDASTYPNDPPQVTNPTLHVSVPGFEVVELAFVVNELNLLDSSSLGITDTGQDPLPDGIYIFKYEVDPASENYVEKTIMRVERLQEKFDEAFMKLDMMQGSMSVKKQQKVTLDTIYYFIQGSVAAANNCSTIEAIELYKKADKLLYDFTQRGECCGITFPSNFY